MPTVVHNSSAGSASKPYFKSRLCLSLAVVLLAVMAGIMFSSAWDDTANADETVTVVSGYSYLQIRGPGPQGRRPPLTRDLGNPPLTEDLAAIPLLFLPLHPPPDHIARGEKENDPDVLGQEFLYYSGNDPDTIMRAARAPMILFAIAFGAVLFWWTRSEFGDATALLTLFLYAFSPTFLAHGRIVTTDVAAAAGFFVATIAFLRFLKKPSLGNTALAGVAMGFAFLTKFSTVAMVPIAFILAIAWAMVQRGAGSDASNPKDSWFTGLARLLGKTLCVFAIAYLAIYPVYLHNVWPYPPERQAREAFAAVQQYGAGGTAKDIVLWASRKPLLRPWAQYFLGIIVTLKASHWGQGLFFMGKILPTGFRLYFPFVYLVKEPLALHLLTLAALFFALFRLRFASLKLDFLRDLFREHFTEFALLLVLAVYWAALIRSNMNLGIRHLLPAFPFTFVLVSAQIVSSMRGGTTNLNGQGRLLTKWGAYVALTAVLCWQAFSVLRVHPSYLSYFNELVGGADGGWRYVNDSNLDWGQDVKRLAEVVERRNIPGIHADLFGRVDPAYYLKGKYLGPLGCTEQPHGWVAVSAMVYPGSPWNPTCDYQNRLPMDKLVTKIGYSIFVFHVD